jgi:large subunit ribosomal protein L19e
MKLDKKKAIAARVFGVGKKRIIFVEPRLDEIKEAITKDDIRALKEDGAIIIRPIKARRSTQKRKVKRGPGNIRKKARSRKREYITITRKLRKDVQDLKNKKLLTKEQTVDIRKKIRNRFFRSKAHLKEYINTLEK